MTVRSVTVERSVEKAREVFRDAGRLSTALDRPVSLEQAAADMWRCRVDDGSGRGADVEVIVRHSGNLLSWQVEQDPVPHEGRVTLSPAPGGRGTEIRVELRYPGTRIGRLAAVLRGRDPDQALRTTLRRLKSVLECGQVVSTLHDPSGRRRLRSGAASPRPSLRSARWQPRRGAVAERVTRAVRERLATGGRP